MATTLYKGPALGKLPPCLICAGPGEGPRERLNLTHGVSVWLCAGHRAPAFLTRRAGRDLAARLGALWSAAGCLTARRRRTLKDHLRRVCQPTAPGRPGSHAWPALRREAERRLGAGEPPAGVIGELRERHRGAPARVPSIRTMRRWFHDGRWLPRGAGGPRRGTAPAPAPSVAAERRPAPFAGRRADDRHPPNDAQGASAEPRHRGPPPA